jgi:hypothetical protein
VIFIYLSECNVQIEHKKTLFFDFLSVRDSCRNFNFSSLYLDLAAAGAAQPEPRFFVFFLHEPRIVLHLVLQSETVIFPLIAGSWQQRKVLAFQFRISYSWISKIVQEVMKAICHRMLHEAIPQPTTDQLTATAKGFYQSRNFPNCCGAMDGKRIRIINPANAGSLFFSYKSYFSVVLLALVDANYRLLVVDIGSYGKEGDAGIFAKSALGKSVSNGSFGLPYPMPLPGTDTVLPHDILDDEAFKLTINMMRSAKNSLDLI